VQRERGECNEAADDRVPIENAGRDAGLPVGPQGQEEIPIGIDGTPRSTLAKAAPKKMVRRALEKPKTPSSSERQTPTSRWLRISRLTPRSTSSQSTIMSGR